MVRSAASLFYTLVGPSRASVRLQHVSLPASTILYGEPSALRYMYKIYVQYSIHLDTGMTVFGVIRALCEKTFSILVLVLKFDGDHWAPINI